MFQEAAGNRCLASTHFTGQKDKAAVRIDAEQEVRQRFTVLVAQVEKPGIRRNGEWGFAQTEVVVIHRISRIKLAASFLGRAKTAAYV